jgi:hypothetical protein
MTYAPAGKAPRCSLKCRPPSYSVSLRSSDTDPSPSRHPNNTAGRNHGHTGNTTQPGIGEAVTESIYGFADARGAFVPINVAECALDDQLEQLQRQYAAATRAASRAKFELELLEKRDDIPAHMVAQAKRQRAAAEIRSARLLSAIDALEDRLENE